MKYVHDNTPRTATQPDKIEQMYAFVSSNKQGQEGIMAFRGGDGQWYPMVGADLTRIQSLLPTAQEISKLSGEPFRVLLFDHMQDVTAAVLEGKNFG